VKRYGILYTNTNLKNVKKINMQRTTYIWRSVWRYRKSTNDRQHNGQQKKDKQRSTKHCT